MVRPVLGPNVTARYEHELQAIDGIGLTDIEMDAVVTLIAGHARARPGASLEAALAERRTGQSDQAVVGGARANSRARDRRPGPSGRRPGRDRPRARPTTPRTRLSTPFGLGCNEFSMGSRRSSAAGLRTTQDKSKDQVVESGWTLFLSFEISPILRSLNGGEPFHMRTLRSACAVLATVFACAIGAAPAIADTVVIDSVDSPSAVFQPANVTIETGDTVRWEFDAAATTHNVTSPSSNWTPSTNRAAPNGAPIERTFNTVGTYTFLCTLHTGMTGSITVEAPALERVLVFSRTGGFRHDSIPQGIAAIQALGTANGFDGRRHRGPGPVHGRQPRQLRRRRLPVDDRRGPQRRAAGRLRALHPGRRRLRRRPRGLRHRVLLAVVRRAGRRLLPQPPARNADRGGRHRGRRRALHHRPAGPLDAHGRVVQLPAPDDPGRQRQHDGRRLLPARPSREGPRHGRRVDLRRAGRQHDRRRPPDRVVLGLRRRPLLVHGHGPHPGVVRRARTSAATCSAACAPRPASAATAATSATCRRPRPTSRRSRSTTTRTRRWRSTSPTDGRAFYIELDGRVQMWSPTTQTTTTVATIPVTLSHENGLLGIQLAPDFDDHRPHLPGLLGAARTDAGINRVSRFTLTGNTLGQEQIIYTWQHQRQECCHTGGSLDFGPDGNLYLSTGDNTNPFAHGFNPTDERPGPRDLGRAAHVGQHEQPERQDPAHPADPERDGHARASGTTYTIPVGQPLPGRHAPRPCPRSTRWASATRSGSTSTRRPAGC